MLSPEARNEQASTSAFETDEDPTVGGGIFFVLRLRRSCVANVRRRNTKERLALASFSIMLPGVKDRFGIRDRVVLVVLVSGNGVFLTILFGKERRDAPIKYNREPCALQRVPRYLHPLEGRDSDVPCVLRVHARGCL